MRSIKFRAFRKDAKESGVVIGYSNDSDGEHVHIKFFTNDGKYQYEKWYKIDDPDIVLMQSTGTKDKDESEIFEGDILTGKLGKLAEVKWLQEHCAYVGYCIEDRKYYCLECGDDKLKNVSIIGNIYTNPELITV